MKRVLATVVAFMSLIPLWSAEPFKFKGSEATSTGVYVLELSSGRVIAEYNSQKAFIPASVMKCVTAATAQLMLYGDNTFSTKLAVRGDIVEGTLEGNLYIVGDGDPTLESRHIKNRESFVSTTIGWLVSLGIDSIAGDIIVDGSRLPSIGVSPYWLLEDTAWEYGAGLYGINYRDNSFSMTLRSDDSTTSVNPLVEVVNLLRHGSKSEVVAMRGEGSELLTVTGTLSTPSYTSRYSMPSPEIALYYDIRDALTRHKIGIGGEFIEEYSNKSESMVYNSPDRDDILKPMMSKSINLYAEGMLRAIVDDNGDKTADNAIAIEKALWEKNGVDVSKSRWLDGSGLSPVNRMSPYTLASVLRFMARADLAKNYVGLFPLVGREGTVSRLLSKTRLEGRLALKSGSMNGVLCYAGYKLDAKGNPSHVVVIMVNGATCGSTEIRAAVGRYLLTLF